VAGARMRTSPTGGNSNAVNASNGEGERGNVSRYVRRVTDSSRPNIDTTSVTLVGLDASRCAMTAA
jgi:hypothetical protein